MKNINIIGLLVLLLLISSSCEEDKIDFDRYGSLTGLVIDGETLEPLEGVLIATNPASSSVVTLSSGEFSFEKVLAGEVSVTGRKNDYLTNNVLVSVYEDESTQMTLTLFKDEKDYGSVNIYDPIPGNGAVDQLTSFEMGWNVDQSKSSIELTYDVYLFQSNSTSQMLVGEGLSTKKVVVDNLMENTTYYWYVVAKYDGDLVANSPTWSFKTGDMES